MNLQKLFEMQAELDAVIVEKQNLKEVPLNNLILALIVELDEMANEWQGFKHWKVNKTARTLVVVSCSNCAGTGTPTGIPSYTGVDCWQCGGEGTYTKNPLLEELADVLSFMLAIGNQLHHEIEKEKICIWEENIFFAKENITDQILEIADEFTDLWATQTLDNYSVIMTKFAVLCEMLGFTWDEIEQAYFAKNKTNHERQMNGY